MDSSSPETMEQLRAENQRLRAENAALAARAGEVPPTSAGALLGPPIWFDSVGDAIVVTDPSWHIQHWNRAAEQLYGWPRTEAVGRPLADVVAITHHLDDTGAAPALQTLIATGSWRGTFAQRTRDGRRVVVEGAAQVISDPQGAVIGYVAITRDITDHTCVEQVIANAQLYQQAQAAQQVAAAALARLDALITSAPLGIAQLDADLRYVLVNPALAAINNLAAEAHIGRTLAEVVPLLAPRLEPLARQVLATGQALPNFEVYGQRGAEEIAYAGRLNLYPVPGPTGAVAGVGVTVTDITQSTRTAAALRASENRFRLLAEHAQDVIYRYRLVPDLALEYVSPIIEPLTGYPREAFYHDADLGRRLIHPDDLRIFDRMLIDSSTFDRPVILRVLRPDGAIIWGELHSWQIIDDAGQPVAIEGIARDITARKQAETALLASQQSLATLIENTDGLIWSVDPQYRLIVGNGLFHQHTRASSGQDLRPGARLVALDQPQAVLDEWRGYYDRALAGESFSVEVPTRFMPDLRMVEYRFSPIRTAEGAITGATIFGRDITERRETQRALDEHAARLASLLAHAPIGVSLLDTELRFQQINAYLAELNGLAPEAHLGRPIGEVLPALAPALEDIYSHVLATGTPLLDVEIVGETPATPGVLRVCHASYFPVHAADGTILGVGGVVLDITEQRQAEQALQREHQQMEAIMQALDEGVIAIHPDGALVVMNPAVRRLMMDDPAVMPRTAQEVVAMSTAVLRDADGQPIAHEDWPIMRVLRQEHFSNWDLRLCPPGSQEERWITTSGMTIRNADGSPFLGIVTRSDITQRKRDEAALRAHAEALSKSNADLTRALRLKDEFLAMMSHELRTPLSVILGVSEAMGDGIYGPVSAEQRQGLDSITQSGRHLLSILSDILDLAYIEAGHESINRQPIDMDRIGRTAMQYVHAAACQQGVRLLRSIEQGLVGMRADERRLTQILVNLLSNAIKFTPAGGTAGLEITGDAAHEQIQLTVWDTGIGIAAGDYDRLFQPFTQIEGTLSRRYGGIGLGLALVRRLVDLHGGSISLESTPDQGSRFTVSLPWAAEDNVAPSPAPAPPPRTSAWARPPQVVLADDHEPTLAFYLEMLTGQGCQVMAARTGDEALAHVLAARPDVAVLDIQMPGMDGLTAIRRIRADARAGATPIIALTALAMPGDRERCLAAGANIYLAKPVSLSTLIAAIATLLAPHAGDDPTGG